MAEGGDADWELCKENIQPLKGGRAIAALNQALSLQEGFSSATNQHKQAFESELRLYEGDDPLDVWDRYVKWTEQTFPQGGKESNLSVLLERAVMRFTKENKYHNDVRYVDLWIKFAENCPEPLDVYRYMQAQGIGTMQASFYIAWSEEYEKQANYHKADTVFQEGFRCHAEPLEKLKQFHKGLQARVSRQVMTGMLEEDEEDAARVKEQERMSLVDLKHRGKKKAVAPINRVGAALSGKSSGLSSQGEAAAGSGSNTRFRVFDENRAVSAAPAEPRLESWMAPPTSRAKENEQRPEKWSSIKMPQRSRFGHVVVAPPSEPNFQPFVEESDQPPAMTPCKINPAVNSVLSARKPCREETPLKRLQEHSQQQASGGASSGASGGAQSGASSGAQEQSMYCKELLLSGASEFCFEELRAERYRQRVSAEPSGREG
ncbi:mitotic checkpoint serine/threonine-protein kinase BUB1 beta [Osmerus mordax]|uniref:mitotic checkpoint serine/threonine-protein kinase BUB1 beta n=1 Tax=Osmerus mordax TaxID=8014 RepID=UPI0035102827